MIHPNEHLFQALGALGQLLQARGATYSCVVAGGTALAALGVIERATGDVDVMAIGTENGRIERAPAEFPPVVNESIRDVSRELNLPPNWMNAQMARGLIAGMPPGFEGRLHWRQFGAMSVGFVTRLDLIALKLEASSDDPPHGRSDVHLGDLVALGATDDELVRAAEWVLAVNVDPRRTQTIDWVRTHVAARHRR